MPAKPRDEHRWLHRLIGEWTFESEADMDPGQPPMKSTGSERVRSLGGLWVIAEGEGEMPGGGAGYMIMTLGFDPRTGRYSGNWIGSMMTHMWVYDGELDASGKVLTLHSEGPDFSDSSRMGRYQDIIEWVDDDTRLLRSRTQGADSQWKEFMVARYSRTG